MSENKKKLAIFVEGQTEQIFLYRLLMEIAGRNAISFVCERMHGGSPGPTLWLKQSNKTLGSEGYYVLLVDCMGDETVKSAMLDRRESLQKAGYSMILGLRDLYPKSAVELSKMKQRMASGIPPADILMRVIIAVPEVEAWFLQEYHHYAKIHPNLDIKKFGEVFGFDPQVQSAESVEHPAALLHKIYSSVGLAYQKKKNQAERTVDALDYAHMYVSCPAVLPQLNEFIKYIDDFLQ